MDFPTISRIELFLKWEYVLTKCDHIYSWTDGHELAWLAEMAGQARTICEVGSYHGKSAKVMALASGLDTDILCIDNFENKGSESEFRTNLKEEITAGKVSVFKGTSDLLKDHYAEDTRFDLAFIDAGHLVDDLIKDIKNVRPLMAPGSIICGHDWRVRDMNDGVNQAVIKILGHPHVIFDSIWAIKL